MRGVWAGEEEGVAGALAIEGRVVLVRAHAWLEWRAVDWSELTGGQQSKQD